MSKGLNWDALNEATSEIEEDVKKSGGNFSYSHLVEDWHFGKGKDGQTKTADFRIILPSENMGGSYYQKIVKFKFGKKQFISKQAFGEHCVLDELWAQYKKKSNSDADIKALFDNFRQCQRQIQFVVPILLFSNPEAEDGLIPDDEESKLLFLKASNFDKLHKLIVNPKYRKADKVWGVLSRESGRNFTISDSGKVIQPDPDPTDLSGEYYDDYYSGDKRKDIWEHIYALQKSDEHLESVMRNYFEGAEITLDDGSTRKALLGETTEEEAPKPASKPAAKKKAPAKKQPGKPKPAAKQPGRVKQVQEADGDGDDLLDMMEKEAGDMD